MTLTDLGRWAAALALAPLVVACGSAGGSAISSVSPEAGSARGGDAVILTGSGFGASPVVRFGDLEAKVTSATDTRIEVVAPRSIAGAVTVDVEADGNHTRKEKGFTYLPLPLAFVDAAWSRFPPLAIDGGGAVIADADGDGDGDIFQAGRSDGVWITANDGKGSFTDPRLIRPEGDPTDVSSVVVRDLDGDGKLDLFLGTTSKKPSQLLLGDGNNGFTPSLSALPPLFGTDQRAIALDIDGDGDIDLVTVGSAPTADAPPGVALLTNDSQGMFIDVAFEHLPGGAFGATGVAAGDVDGDGDVDLFFSADQEACRLYLNDGHGIFQRAAPDAIPYDPAPGAGAPALGDLDGDGSLDIYLPTATQDRVLFNDGKGRFVDLTDVRLGPESGAGKSVALADLDLDGHLDAVVVERPGRLRLYRNDGTGRLFDYSGEIAGNSADLRNADVAVGDLDGDGDEDIFVSHEDFSRAALLVSWSPLPDDDTDGDGVPDTVDSCPAAANPGQENLDSLPFRCSSAAMCKAETGCDLRASGGAAYLICRTATLSWPEAVAACKARGAEMVTVSSAEENAYLTGLGVENTWLGFTDAETEGTYVWASGVKSGYLNWGMAQPDDAGASEDCAQFLADGTWNDNNCTAKLGYVCEDLRSRAPDPGDACDACLTIYEPGSAPVSGDAGLCGGAGGAGGGAPDGGP
jgi:hypothetical protein